jgi:hypothetical protein
VLARFAAGPSGVDAATTAENTAAARTAVSAYFAAWNSHDHKALAEVIHYPHVRVDGRGDVEVWRSASEFLAGSEPARQRTWFETRLDAAQVIQVSADGVNVAFRFSRRDRTGSILSASEAMALIVRRDTVWRVQALSTMGA